MRKIYLFMYLGILSISSYSQIGIGVENPHPSALLEINSSDKGFLIPRVALTSVNDNTTVANPVDGMIVIASTTTGTSENDVIAGRIYKFSGTIWNELVVENEPISKTLYPEIVAIGKKTSVSTACAGANRASFSLDNRNNIKATINANGSLVAHKSGYFLWSINLRQYMQNNAYDPFILPSMVNYGFREGTTGTWAWNTISISGSVYLAQNQVSNPFSWNLGGEFVCRATDRIGEQLVVWQYIGE